MFAIYFSAIIEIREVSLMAIKSRRTHIYMTNIYMHETNNDDDC